MSEGLHAKWRIRRSWTGWVVDEWNCEKSYWVLISIAFGSHREAHFYMHCNALVECSIDNEDWKFV